VVEDPQAEPGRAPRHGPADAPEPHDAERLVGRLSWPSIISGAQIQGCPARRNPSPSATRRAAASRRGRVQARSAVLSVRTSGVLETRTLRREQAATSMLSIPAT